MPYRIKGTLKLPVTSQPAAGVDIEFISRRNYSPLLTDLSSIIKTSPTGAYDVTLEYGEYAVVLYWGCNQPSHIGKLFVFADTVAGLDLQTLLQQADWQPATPEYIQQIQGWLADSLAAANQAAESAAAAKASELAAEADRAEIASNKTIVVNAQADVTSKRNDVTTKAAQVAANTATVNEKTQIAVAAADTASQKAIAAAASDTSARGAATRAENSSAAAKTSELTAKSEADRAKREADKASQVVIDSATPFPDVWLPFNDSLRMITGFGDYDRVYIGDQYLELNSRSARFERATEATCTDKSGVLRTVAINEPRFEKEGLLIEGQSTNLFRGDSLRTPSGVVTSKVSSSKYPDIVATKAVGAQTSPIIIGASREPIENSTVYSASVIIDLANSNITTGLVRYRFAYNANWPSRYIDVYTDGRVLKLGEGTTGSAKVVGDLLFIAMTTTSSDTASASGGGSVDVVSLLESGAEPSGAPAGYSVCVVGFQLEKSSLASSYIPTKDSAVTRATDKCWIQTSGNFPSVKGFTASCSVTASWVGAVAPNPAPRVLSIQSDAASAVESSIYPDGRFNSYGIGGGSFVPFASGDTVSTIIADVISSQVGNVRVDGGATYPWGGVRGEIYIGTQSGGNSRALFGHIRNLRIWHSALSDAQIKGLK